VKNQDVFHPGAVEHSHPPTLTITEASQVRAKIRTEAQLHPFIPDMKRLATGRVTVSYNLGKSIVPSLT